MNSIQQFLTEGIKNLNRVSEEFAKDPSKFAEFVTGIREVTNSFELNFIADYLEERDRQIVKDGRRKARWHVVRRDRKQLVTSLGTVSFKKTLFENKETGKCAYLLDEVMKFGDHMRMTEDAVSRVLSEAVESSYRRGGEAACMNEESVSRETVKTLVHGLKFPAEKAPAEKRKVKVLYIDADEDHVSLQFREHKGDLAQGEGPKTNTVLSKLVYVYEGIEREAPGSKRWQLVNRHCFCGVYEGAENKKLWEEVANYIESHYDVDTLEKVYLNGDGGGWIRAGKECLEKVTMVLDGFHISKYLNRMTGFLKDSADDAKDDICRIVRKGTKAELKEYCEKLRSHAAEKDLDGIRRGEGYLLNNWRAAKMRLSGLSDVKGCSAEGHVEHVLSARMSSDPLGWSIRGVDRMSHLRAYACNGGDILSLVRYQKQEELLPAAGSEGVTVLSCEDILRSERSRYKETMKYVERMQASISMQTKAQLHFRSHIIV